MNKIQASIVIPVFNRAHLVSRAIDSALAQTVPCEVEGVIAELQKKVYVQPLPSLRLTRLVAKVDRLKSIIAFSERK